MWRHSILIFLASTALAAEIPTLSTPAVPHTPWTVAGEHGAVLGRQDGSFEAWLWPVKILSHFRITAELADYPVPIDVNSLAATVSVSPAETIITYSHAAFTIKQHAFAARGMKDPAAGAALFFEIESLRPIAITFSFTPEMLRMWPAPNFGHPDAEWVKTNDGGYYILHTSNPKFSGTVGMPGTQPGIMVPYQEHPQNYPLQLKLAFDPRADSGKIFPLKIGMGTQTPINTNAVAKLLRNTQNYYSHFLDSRTTIETPDSHLDEAVKWAEVSLDQMQVDYHGETGMVAGYYESADSARPGYAWFFGRDTLWSTYAINSYGDFALTRRALDFLIRRQRADGKIMHEFSQSADAIDWADTPYFYASADAVPLFVMAMWDYVRGSGDVDYLKRNWTAVRKAYAFERAHDSDGDGIYENTEGTGWVESWPPGMPHQEIYLAALDQQSTQAMSSLAELMNENELAQSERARANKIAKTIEAEYLDKDRFYAFSRNANGSLDYTPSIFPAVAWWQETWGLKQPDEMLSRWAAPEFSTDWGTRDISARSPYFDAISYHQGSVWPLFTGWVSLAEYRAGRSLSAYAHLMQNVRLTWLQDIGSATELLSGEFYQPLGRSSSHQMWSSAMILAPVMKGLFGLQPDALNHTLIVAPHLPAKWEHASVHNLHIGSDAADLEFVRKDGQLLVRAVTKMPVVLCLAASSVDPTCGEPASMQHVLTLHLPAVEVELPDDAPAQGDTTHTLKVIDQQFTDHEAAFTFAAPAGTSADLYVRRNNPQVRSEGLTIDGDHLRLHFAGGTGYATSVVKFHW